MRDRQGRETDRLVEGNKGEEAEEENTGARRKIFSKVQFEVYVHLKVSVYLYLSLFFPFCLSISAYLPIYFSFLSGSLQNTRRVLVSEPAVFSFLFLFFYPFRCYLSPYSSLFLSSFLVLLHRHRDTCIHYLIIESSDSIQEFQSFDESLWRRSIHEIEVDKIVDTQALQR